MSAVYSPDGQYLLAAGAGTDHLWGAGLVDPGYVDHAAASEVDTPHEDFVGVESGVSEVDARCVAVAVGRADQDAAALGQNGADVVAAGWLGRLPECLVTRGDSSLPGTGAAASCAAGGPRVVVPLHMTCSGGAARPRRALRQGLCAAKTCPGGVGERGGIRTRMPVRAAEFKSAASSQLRHSLVNRSMAAAPPAGWADTSDFEDCEKGVGGVVVGRGDSGGARRGPGPGDGAMASHRGGGRVTAGARDW